MPISIQPPPSDGPLSPTGSPPSVQLTVTLSGPGAFSVTLVGGARPQRIESGFLPGGATKLRIFLPTQIPPGARLVIEVGDALGGAANFVYSF